MNLNDLKTLSPKFQVDTFEHVLGHVYKAAGKLHGLVGDADHIYERQKTEEWRWDIAFQEAEQNNDRPASVYIADLIICAAKLADLCPSGELDLDQIVADRIAEKNDYLKQYK